MLEINSIYNMDCLEGLNEINEIDLVVTSPPYNVNLGNNKYNKSSYDVYQDNMSHSEYLSWMKQVFSLIYLKLKSGGRVCINIGDSKNGSIPTHSDFIQMMKEIGYLSMACIIWNKNTMSARTTWGSYMSPSCPSFPTPFEYILVFAKDSKKLQYRGETDLTKEEFIAWSLALWTFAPEKKQKQVGHPAMFPEELAKRCIKMFSWIGAFVVDPFCGSGTTCKVAKTLNRKYVGFDISTEYCEIAHSRLEE